jgi:hypothetical protein
MNNKLSNHCKDIAMLKANRYRLVCLFSVVWLSGCASLGVEPWERDLLAKKEMALSSAPIDASLDDHIYFSKEATSGGRSFGGGGCGCN